MDNDAFISTFSSMRQRLLVMAERITGNRDDAADAVQDAFCRLWTRRESIVSPQAVQGMSVVTVHNLSIDTVRRRSAHRTVALDDNCRSIQDVPSQELNNVFYQVQRIVNEELSDTQRQILEMREFEGRSFEEIAKVLDLQPVNVRVQLSRARKKVREIYRSQQR